MKNLIIAVVLMLTTSFAVAQKQKEAKLNPNTNLIETVYYHENGEVSQKGTFDRAGKLHGKWVSFSENGEKRSMGSYNNGARSGTWYFFTGNNVQEVEFENNSIASVTKLDNTSGLVTKD